jgi:hypothetical protein
LKRWGGRESTRLIALTLASKGTVCHLCSTGPDDPVGQGADSADHDPPRVALVRLGVPNPDDPRFLWPAHLTCNLRRNDRPFDDDLRAYLRERRLHDLGLAPSVSAARLSPAIAARRPGAPPTEPF